VNDAALHHGALERAGDGVLEPGQPVAAGDQDVPDAPVLQVGRDRPPEPGALPGGAVAGRGLGHPDAQHVLLPVRVDPDGEVGGLVLHGVVVADPAQMAAGNTAA
jgi:hypothetical protein